MTRKNIFEQTAITAGVAAAILVGTLAYKSTHAQSPAPSQSVVAKATVTELPEDAPAEGDLLYVINIRTGATADTFVLGYYKPQGKDAARYPNFQAADASEGIHNRYTDAWVDIATIGAPEGQEEYE